MSKARRASASEVAAALHMAVQARGTHGTGATRIRVRALGPVVELRGGTRTTREAYDAALSAVIAEVGAVAEVERGVLPCGRGWWVRVA